ncbi:hypothetical protein [Arthrobacter sp. RIT-PI-e]|nr:hypothetical protein [Arthrobacter sp. RIT-PI-e]
MPLSSSCFPATAMRVVVSLLTRRSPSADDDGARPEPALSRQAPGA